MPAERFEIRIPALKLLIAMLVTIIPVCFVALLSITRTDNALKRTIGSHFRAVALMSAGQVADFIHERVMEVRDLAISLAVADAVDAANKKYLGRSDAEIDTAAQRIEETWNTVAVNPLASEILSSGASRLLRKYQQFDPQLLRATVTDMRGGVVAATHKPVKYFHADQEFWQSIYASGGGAVSITDVLYDNVTKSNYIGIGMPILEEGTNRLIGVMEALVEVSANLPILRQVQLGNTGRLMLVKDDGTVVGAPGIPTGAKMKSDEFAALRDALGTASGLHTGYIVATLTSGSQLIGFANTGLKDDYSKLGWVVLAVQDSREAFASVNTVDRLLAIMSILGLGGVVVFGVYVSSHRSPSYVDLAEASEPSATVSRKTVA